MARGKFPGNRRHAAAADPAPAADLHTIERELRAGGCRLIAGIDEAGRGPLAGPVCAAAVVFDGQTMIEGVNDSKQLTAADREQLHDEILRRALAAGIGLATAEEIDALNILEATRLAARRALKALKVLPDILLLDALRLDGVTIPQQPLIKGDARCFSIAAASILAKVTRDRLMQQYDAEYPLYGFAHHKGYPTRAHYDCLERHGPSTIHRKTFYDGGFFAGPPVHSRSYMRLRAALQGTDAHEAARAADEMRAMRGFLPECEWRELNALVPNSTTPEV
ncbi:MAG: ribonuclease HII [Candidatus Sumerlaeaceae bacterium]|nr:ribonuclease HII [Candidatus Sumerlaeaceae bacterium]